LARYLLVVPETDESPELVGKARELVDRDPEAEFVLVVPATPVPALLGLLGETWSPRTFAGRRARRARAQLMAAGLPLVATRLGNWDPLRAVEDALRYADYSAVVIFTWPHALSHWQHRDLPHRLAQRYPSMLILHVVVRYSHTHAARDVSGAPEHSEAAFLGEGWKGRQP
jgi:hypothetical protein